MCTDWRETESLCSSFLCWNGYCDIIFYIDRWRDTIFLCYSLDASDDCLTNYTRWMFAIHRWKLLDNFSMWCVIWLSTAKWYFHWKWCFFSNPYAQCKHYVKYRWKVKTRNECQFLAHFFLYMYMYQVHIIFPIK